MLLAWCMLATTEVVSANSAWYGMLFPPGLHRRNCSSGCLRLLLGAALRLCNWLCLQPPLCLKALPAQLCSRVPRAQAHALTRQGPRMSRLVSASLTSMATGRHTACTGAHLSQAWLCCQAEG